jgi:hypothetical protein
VEAKEARMSRDKLEAAKEFALKRQTNSQVNLFAKVRTSNVSLPSIDQSMTRGKSKQDSD